MEGPTCLSALVKGRHLVVCFIMKVTRGKEHLFPPFLKGGRGDF